MRIMASPKQKVIDDIKNVAESSQEQKRKHGCYLKVLIIISVINLIIQLIQMFK